MVFGILAAVISVLGEIPYIRDIIRGRVRPERASWGIWTLILIVALWSYDTLEAGQALIFIIGELVTTAAIFGLSLWRGVGGFVIRDLYCIAIAVLGVIVWQVTDQPAVALAAVVLADGAGVYPTVIKALRDPCSENASTFASSTIAAALGILAVGQWNLVLLGYPVYLFLANFITSMVIVVGQHHTTQDSVKPF